jgi:hypothetical protein
MTAKRRKKKLSLKRFGIKRLKLMRDQLHPGDSRRETVYEPLIDEKLRKKYAAK